MISGQVRCFGELTANTIVSSSRKGMFMFHRILVPVDGSETSTKALRAALQLAREVAANVRVLHTLDDAEYLPTAALDYGGDTLKLGREQADKIVQEALEFARDAGVQADSRLVEKLGLRLGDVVAEEARSWQADLVVVGTHGRRGASRLLLGSGAEQVIRQSPVPVLVFRDPAAAS
jgi:nucleotide-binding universal stress UspA family protein